MTILNGSTVKKRIGFDWKQLSALFSLLVIFTAVIIYIVTAVVGLGHLNDKVQRLDNLKLGTRLEVLEVLITQSESRQRSLRKDYQVATKKMDDLLREVVALRTQMDVLIRELDKRQ